MPGNEAAPRPAVNLSNFDIDAHRFSLFSSKPCLVIWFAKILKEASKFQGDRSLKTPVIMCLELKWTISIKRRHMKVPSPNILNINATIGEH